jgi:hypothetical protein
VGRRYRQLQAGFPSALQEHLQLVAPSALHSHEPCEQVTLHPHDFAAAAVEGRNVKAAIARIA